MTPENYVAFKKWQESINETNILDQLTGKTHQTKQMRLNNPPPAAKAYMDAYVAAQRAKQASEIAPRPQPVIFHASPPPAPVNSAPYTGYSSAFSPMPSSGTASLSTNQPIFPSSMTNSSSLQATQAHTAWLSQNLSNAWNNRP